jgi:predicted HicB family RNase H-like nuclease
VTNVNHYTYRVTWSPEDNEHIGLVSEFPSLSWLASDQVDALLGIRTLVDNVVAEMQESGEEPPIPIADRNYSGVFKVRIPPEVHRALVAKAAEDHISLNRLVSAKLAG